MSDRSLPLGGEMLQGTELNADACHQVEIGSPTVCMDGTVGAKVKQLLASVCYDDCTCSFCAGQRVDDSFNW